MDNLYCGNLSSTAPDAHICGDSYDGIKYQCRNCEREQIRIPYPGDTIPHRSENGFYIFQVSSYGEAALHADEPCEIILYKPMPCTPSGDLVADVSTARLADKALEKISHMSLDEAKIFLLGRNGFTVKGNHTDANGKEFLVSFNVRLASFKDIWKSDD